MLTICVIFVVIIYDDGGGGGGGDGSVAFFIAEYVGSLIEI